MRGLVLLLGFVACAAPPPCSFELRELDSSGTEVTLLHVEFASYAEAIEAGPFNVTVTEGTRSQLVTKSPGACQPFSCTGPVVLERLLLTVEASKSYIRGFTCQGEDGGITGAIDQSTSGACRL